MSTDNGDVILSQNPTDMLEQARNYVERVQQAKAREEAVTPAALLAFVHARLKEERQDFLEHERRCLASGCYSIRHSVAISF